MEHSRRRAARAAGPHAARSRRLCHAVVILDVFRPLLAEPAQVVGELHHIVAADHAVGRILRPPRARRTGEGLVLVEDVVHADHDLAALVLEDLFADPGVAQQVGIVVIVRKTDVLRIGHAAREGKAQREDELHVALRRMVEITVLGTRFAQRVGRLVIGTGPRKGEVHVLRNVAAQYRAEVVADILGVVALAARDEPVAVDHTAQHARGLGEIDARHHVEVTLQEPDGEPVAQVRAQVPVTVEVDGGGVVVGGVLLAAEGDRTGVRDQVVGVVIRRILHREHPHERPSLLHVGVRIVEIDPVAVRRVQVGVTLGDVLRVRHVGHVLEVGDRGVVGIGRDEQAQRILAVDVQLPHHEIDHVVIRMLDLVGGVAYDLPVERGMLVIDVRHERVALLRITEAGAGALRQVTALVRVGKRPVGEKPCDRIVRPGYERPLVALLIIVADAVLHAHLGIFGHRFRIGELPAQAVAVRGGEVAQVTQTGIARRVPAPRAVGSVGTDGRNRQDVREGIRVVGIVRIIHIAVEGDRTAVLPELGTVDGARAQVITVAQAVVEILGAAVTALAELPALRRAQGIVGLVAETGAHHQILVVGDLPLQAGVETVVVGLRIRIAARREGVHRHGGFIPLVHRGLVLRIGIVEEIAALERHLVAFAPCVGVVDADGVHRRHAALRTHHVLSDTAAAAAAGTRYAEDVLEREILLVDIIEQADDRHAAVAAEDIGITAYDIFVFGLGLGIGIVTVTGIQFTELSLPHVGMGDDVERLITLAVVHAREFGGVAQFVVDLDAVDSLCRQRLDGRRHVLAEKFLAVDENLFDRLALCLDRTVAHGDARHLLEQAFDVGIVGDLERPGVIAYRIALLGGAERLGLLDDGFDLHARPEFDLADVLFGGRDLKGGFRAVVAQERDYEFIFAVCERGDRHGALIARSGILFLVGGSGRGEFQHGTRDRLAGIGVDHRTRDRPLLGKGGDGEKCK